MRRVLFALAVVLAVDWRQPAARAREAETIVLTLRPTATASGSQVKLGDIADLQGCEEAERERLARLDLAELPLSSQPIMVTQQQIGFRLQLAGLTAGSYRLDGPRCIRVSRPAGEGLDAKIAAAARQALEQRITAPADDYRIELAQAVTLPPLSAESEDIHLEGEVHVPVVPPCRVAVEVGIYVRGARRNGIIVYMDVKKLQPVPVAIRKIDGGEVLSAANVRFQRVVVDNTQKVAVAADSLMGRRARRPMSAGHPIEPDDVEADAPTAAVIHANDLVHLIATVGPLQVKTRGEALQDGRIGQAIQVRNLDSKNVVTGRVVDRSTVEVEY
jgi:flagella basal body P-ring formation protein FlgA